MWAFTAIMVISVTYTMYPFLAVSRAMQFTVCAVTAHAIARNATRRQLHLLGHAFLVVVTLSVGLGLAHKSEQTVLHANRFTWLELHPILAGVYCAIAFTLSVAYLTSSRRPRYADPRAAASGVPVNGARWPRLVYLVPLAVTGWALLATETRGATAGALVGSVLVVWLRASGKRRVDLLVGFTLAGVFAAVLASGAIASFVSRGETTQQLATLNSRTELWTLAFQKLRDRPMFGYGLGGTRGLFLDTIGLGGGHNAFVNVLVDQGVVGLLGFVVLLAAVLVTGVRVYRSAARRALPGVRSDAALVLGLFAFLLTNSITVEGLGAPANVSSVLLFALIGWLGLLSRSALAAAPATAPVAGEPVPLGAATVSD
jgi:O-antigen ligase